VRKNNAAKFFEVSAREKRRRLGGRASVLGVQQTAATSGLKTARVPARRLVGLIIKPAMREKVALRISPARRSGVRPARAAAATRARRRWRGDGDDGAASVKLSRKQCAAMGRRPRDDGPTTGRPYRDRGGSFAARRAALPPASGDGIRELLTQRLGIAGAAAVCKPMMLQGMEARRARRWWLEPTNVEERYSASRSARDAWELAAKLHRWKRLSLFKTRVPLTRAANSVNCGFGYGHNAQSDVGSCASGRRSGAGVSIPAARGGLFLRAISARAFGGRAASRHRDSHGGAGEVGPGIAARAATAAVARARGELSPARPRNFRQPRRPRRRHAAPAVVSALTFAVAAPTASPASAAFAVSLARLASALTPRDGSITLFWFGIRVRGCLLLPGSSTAEHSAVNRRVASSNLARGANLFYQLASCRNCRV
jgi:hypothetical protein